MKIKSRNLIPLFLPALMLFSLIGCDSPPDYAALIEKAVEAAGKVQTYRVEGSGASTENGTTTTSNFKMEFKSPDRIYTAYEEPNGLEASIRIGNTEYFKNTGETNWNVRQWNLPVPTINLAAVTVQSLGSLIEIRRLKDEKIDGVGCYHYSGKVDTKAQAEEQRANLDPTQIGYEAQLASIEMLENTLNIYEFWIGKQDNLLRQLKMNVEFAFTRNEGEDDEETEYHNVVATYHFYDFNALIEIAAPPTELVNGAYLVYSMSSTGDAGDDLEHFKVGYEITISNRGLQAARNLKIFLDTPATDRGLQTFEAIGSQTPLDLAPGDSEKFVVNWEYNLAASSKQEFMTLIEQNVLRATWDDENGHPFEETLLDGKQP
jgi:hypothetical protein